MTFNIDIAKEALYIIQVLNNNEYEAYIVGGCVRDGIMGIMPADWDITTNAKPDTVKMLFEKTVDSGVRHGTVTVIINGRYFEVTTYRIDGEYTDNRRPVNVSYTDSLKEDLSRRDFTINAVAYHPDVGLIDPFNGIRDIESAILRTVGEPEGRFLEDALRMLRAIRFAAQLNFDIDMGTQQSIKDNSYLIKSISSERIRDELTKILVSPNPEKFILLKDTGLLQFILPEFEECFLTQQNNPYHKYNVAMHILKSVSHVENDRVLRWTMLLHDIGKPASKTTDDKGVDHFYDHADNSIKIAKGVLERLKFENKTIQLILRLIKHHDYDIKPDYLYVRRAVVKIGEDIFLSLLKVKEADKKAQSPDKLTSGLENLSRIKEIYFDIKIKKQCLGIKDLAVDGNDLIDSGLVPGREIGGILKYMLQKVVENPELNTKEKLLNLIDL